MDSNSSNIDTNLAAENRRKIEGFYDSYLDDLLMQDMLSEAPTPEQRARIFGIIGSMDPDNALEELETTIRKVCPKLVTELWKDQLKEERKAGRADKNRWEKENSYGKHAPEIVIKRPLPARSPDEPEATAKQKNYLKMLGVRDAEFLKSLGRSQASKLIDTVVQLRDSHDLAEVNRQSRANKRTGRPNKISGSGLFMFVFITVVFLVVVARILMGSRS